MRRPIAAIIMTSYFAACASWRVPEGAPHKAPQLSITLADRKTVLLRAPPARGGGLVGFAVQGQGSPAERVRVAFLAADLQRIEARKLDAGKSALALIGLGVLIGLVVAVSNIQTTDPYH